MPRRVIDWLRTSRKPQPFVYLLAAHLVSCIHASCLLTWAMQGFLQFSAPSPHQDEVRSVVGPLLSVAQFPAFQMLDLLPDILSIVCSFVIGYIVGLTIVHFAGRQVFQRRFTSFLWWASVAVVIIDLASFSALAGTAARHPSDYFRYLYLFLLPAPITLIACITAWVERQQVSQSK